MRAVVVFAHGSRDPLWRRPVEAVADAIAALDPSSRVGCAYLELCEPSLPAAVAELVATGASDIRVLPLFFGMGKHAREDLPSLMAALQQQYPTVRLHLLPPAGEHPRLIGLLAEIALEDRPA
ncbi:sirohydrochlorin chelatase [Tepidicella baoligensis]|uniref:sirohydrochlorin chelatase n=1 Tax=Tepidicella baoligensis TaxID=2707016 RepID=UPI0015DA4EFB|nr:CbiX/SirB N-terminal domain-containing protein [Tepidicella baoligensis]